MNSCSLVGEAPEGTDNADEASDVGDPKATQERYARRAVGLPCRSSLGLLPEIVKWVGQMERFTLFTPKDRGSASVLV